MKTRGKQAAAGGRARVRLSRPRALVVAVAAQALVPGLAAAQQGGPGGTGLDAVVVTASGFEQEVRDAPASITVIPREELERKSYSSVAEALSEVEGVDVAGTRGKTGGLNVSIRGMPSDYTLILIDGRRQNAPGNVTPNGFGETSTSFIPPPAAIERIEVIRGPMSTLYGSDAMGGVVNIITRKTPDTWSGTVTAEATVQQHDEFGDSGALNFWLAGPLASDKLGLSVRGSLFKRNEANISYPGAGGTEVVPVMGANPVEARIGTFGARLSFSPTRDHDIWLDFDRARQRYDNSDGQLGTLGNGGYGPTQRYERDQYALSHSWRFDGGRLDSSLMRNETETIGRLIPPGTPGAVPLSPRELSVENTVFDTKLVRELGSHMLTVGGQWWDAEMIDGVAPDAYEHTQWALFAEDEWFFRDDMALTVGARYDHHNVFGSHVSPRGYLVWNANPRWTLKGGVSGGYKTPRLDQLAPGIVGFGSQGRVPLIGSPGLEPETSVSAEIGALYENPAGQRFGITVFNNRFRDKIASGPGLLNCSYAPSPNRPGCADFGNWPAVDTFGQSINIDRAVTRGVELTARAPLSRTWSVQGNYTFTDSEQQSGPEKGEPLTDTPRHVVNLRVNWNPNDRLAGWFSGEYHSERLRPTSGAGINAAARDELGDFKAYTLFSVGGSYKLTKSWTLRAAIYNLFDKDFLEYKAYSSPTATDPSAVAYSNVYNNNLEGRRLWVSATMSF
ncbi:MAG TPA: TonB-dependent receptor [Burkholderiaceae bacterium]|nr:TonB-dependent receptor [Burkholderiaceae bacterium]